MKATKRAFNKAYSEMRGHFLIFTRRDLQIHTAYQLALNACERLVALDPAKRTPEGRLAIGLATAIEAYEKKKYPMPKGKK